MATAAGRFCASARVLYRAIRISQPSGALGFVVSKPPPRSYDRVTRHITSSTTHPPPAAESDAAAAEAAERGLRILRERSESLEQGGEGREVTAL